MTSKIMCSAFLLRLINEDKMFDKGEDDTNIHEIFDKDNMQDITLFCNGDKEDEENNKSNIEKVTKTTSKHLLLINLIQIGTDL